MWSPLPHSAMHMVYEPMAAQRTDARVVVQAMPVVPLLAATPDVAAVPAAGVDVHEAAVVLVPPPLVAMAVATHIISINNEWKS